ncbi:MAG: hypothetical protein MUF38_01485 [Anaerolineae bacterium]|jgi:hypothetical protein|nr:hypothetical protein [Anaerolineae bacterium]
MSQRDFSTKMEQSIWGETFRIALQAAKRAVPMALCFSVAIPLSYALALDVFPDYPWRPLSTKTDPIAVMHEAFTVYAGFWLLSFVVYLFEIVFREAGKLGDRVEQNMILFIQSNPPPEKLRRKIRATYVVLTIPAVFCSLSIWLMGSFTLGLLVFVTMMISLYMAVEGTIRKAKRQGDNHASA